MRIILEILNNYMEFVNVLYEKQVGYKTTLLLCFYQYQNLEIKHTITISWI